MVCSRVLNVLCTPCTLVGELSTRGALFLERKNILISSTSSEGISLYFKHAELCLTRIIKVDVCFCVYKYKQFQGK